MKFLIKNTFNLFLFFTVTVCNAQWTGPTSGVLSTANTVNITKVGGLSTCLGCATLAPLFETKLTGMPTSGVGAVPGGILYPFHVAYSGKIGIGTNAPGATLHIANGGNFRMSRANANPIFTVDPSGRCVLTTDGIAGSNGGFFIHNGTNYIFKITPEMMLFTDGTNDLMKADNNGNLYARKMIVTLTNPFPDYVFDKEYQLMPLAQLGKYIQEHKHLPNIKSAEEIIANNSQIELGEMQAVLTQKIEELTLYILQQQQQIDALTAKLNKD